MKIWEPNWLVFHLSFFLQPISPLQFETMMDRLEKGSGNTVCVVVCVSAHTRTHTEMQDIVGF